MANLVLPWCVVYPLSTMRITSADHMRTTPAGHYTLPCFINYQFSQLSNLVRPWCVVYPLPTMRVKPAGHLQQGPPAMAHCPDFLIINVLISKILSNHNVRTYQSARISIFLVVGIPKEASSVFARLSPPFLNTRRQKFEAHRHPNNATAD